MEAEFLANAPSQGLHCHCPSLLLTDRGDLLAAWYAYPEVECEQGTLTLARRPAGAAEWEPSRAFLGSFEYSAGNPVLFQTHEGHIGLLFVLLKGPYWTDAELRVAYSKDGGAAWSKPAAIGQARGMMVRHAPLVLDSGALLLPAYDEGSNQTVLLASGPDDDRWTERFRFTDPPLIQPSLVRSDDGQLILFFRAWTPSRVIWRSHSVDDGATWSAPVRTTLPNPLSGISAFSAGGRIGVVHNHTEEHRRYPLTLSWTSDGGLTWGEPWHFDTISHEVSYPSFVAEPGGRVHGVYSYNRRLIKYVCFSAEEMGGSNGEN